MKRDSFLAELASIVGPPHVLTDPRDTAPYFTDWRKQYSAAAECVARPAQTGEVARVVELCAREGVAIVPQGGNTGLSGGSVPSGKGREMVLALSRMNRIRDIDALNDTITVEAGCVLAQVQQAAEDAGRLFALSLGAEGSCQIGGNLSTNAGGVNVLRYGNAREQVLGLEVVLPDGRVWNGLRGLRKDNTGYDLKQLFLGAEGTLGVITAAVLRLHPRPTAAATAWIALESPRRAVELLGMLRERLGERVSAFELVSRACLEAVLAHVPGAADPLAAPHPWYVLVELADSGEEAALRDRVEESLGHCSERGMLRDAALAQSEAQARAFWRIRESIPEAQFENVKHDVSVAVSKVPELIERAGAALERAFPGVRIYCFGHVGDGNVHFNVGDASLVARRPEVNRIVYDAVAALGGSISAEHGLGQLKREEIRRHKDPLELELMRTLKRALDPRGLMNPGKLL
ncbi:MAG: hydroxyacid dehydrogenase [Betaproteobacteria bacterium RIFCSPLOWO2_12_FULL_68_20]|nr:MAG: hydroxyacid dehydrogenase [Betaproteobacteria bacterium RIFCSPLOWO2_12_FULL_68_20]